MFNIIRYNINVYKNDEHGTERTDIWIFMKHSRLYKRNFFAVSKMISNNGSKHNF